MSDPIENLIRLAYKEWKIEESKKPKAAHPAPGLLAAFLEKPLSAKDDQGIKLHIIICDSCSESLAVQLALEIDPPREIPPALIKWAKQLPVYRSNSFILAEIFRLKKKILSKLSTHKITTAIFLLQQQLKFAKFNFR
jgi:hypothetical protein